MYWGQIHREFGLLFDLWILTWYYFVGWKTGGHLNCAWSAPSFEMSFHTDVRFACFFKPILVNMPSKQSIWTFQIAANSYFPKTYYRQPHPNEVARNGWKWRHKKLSGGIGLLDHLSAEFEYVDIKSIKSQAANKTEMDLDVSKWNLDRHTKSICVNTWDILKVTNTPVGWWICFETSPVCTFSPEFVGHRHRQKTNICCLAPGVGSRCDIIVVRCWRVWQDECLPWISTSQTQPGRFDLDFCSIFRCIMQHELGSFFLFDSLVQWRQVAACDWSEKTWTPGWMKNFG